MKKKITLLFLATLLVVPFVFGSCNGCGGEPTSSSSAWETMPSDKEETLTLDKTTVADLTIGDSIVVNADYTYAAGAQLTWKSSDENIVKVESIDAMNGKLTAVNLGTATVTATYGEQVASCTITTSTNGIYPVLMFENEVETEDGINKLPTDKVDLGAYVNFNGNRYDDVELTYSLDDTSFGTIDQTTGVLTLANKLGSTTVDVSAKWRGIESELLQKTIKINIMMPPVYELTNNEGVISIIDLYTVNEFEGASLKNKETISVSIKENNVKITDYTVEIVEHVAGDHSDKEVAVWDEATKTVVAKTYGNAKLLLSYVSASGKTFTRYYPITVTCPQGEYETIKYFSTMKGTLPVEDIFSVGEKKIIRATQDGRELTVNADGTAITDIVSQSLTAMSKETVVIYNDVVSYEIPLETYKMVIENEADYFSIFNTQETLDEKGKISYTDTIVAGYYFLKNDLTIAEWDARPNGGYRHHRNLSFYGTFDGNGKTFTSQPLLGGTFGSLKGTVKNLNLVYDVVRDIGARETGKARAMLSQDGKGAIIENVNVRVVGEAGVINQAVSMFGEASGYASLKNIVIDYGATISPDLEAHTQNSYWGLLFHYGKNTNTENVYVISSTMKYLTVYPKETYYTVAENDTKVTHPTIQTQNVQAGVQRYDTWQAFAQAENDLSAFDSTLWDITGGIPAWGASKQEYVIGYVNGVASDEILLNSITETPSTLVLSYGLANVPCELTFKDAATSQIATINDGKITPVKNAFGTGILVATYQLNDVSYEKEFALTVYLGEDETDTTVYTPWTGEGFVWSTTEMKLSIPTALSGHGDVEMIYNQTDDITVYFGEIWMTNTLENITNELIAKDIRVKFADGTGYTAKLDCVKQAISNETELTALLTNNKTIDGYYVLETNITVSSWNTDHLNMKFNGVFDGKGYTITMTDKINGGLFGVLQGRVQNLGVVFNVTKNNIWSYESSRASVIAENALNAVVENLYVKVNTAENITLNQSFSIFGGMWDNYKYTSISNVVLDYSDAEIALDTSTYSVWGGYMFSTTHNDNIKATTYTDVYVISPSAYKYMHIDNGKKNYSIAENDADTITALDGYDEYVLTGVKRYDSWDTFDTTNNLTAFNGEYWNTASGKPIWKTK